MDEMFEAVAEQLSKADHIQHEGTGEAAPAGLSCSRCEEPVEFVPADGLDIYLRCDCPTQPSEYVIPRATGEEEED